MAENNGYEARGDRAPMTTSGKVGLTLAIMAVLLFGGFAVMFFMGFLSELTHS